MAVFPSFNLTKKGEELLNRSIGEGRVLTFTKFKLGDGVPTGDWRELVNVQSSFKEFPVLETAIQADQVLRIRGYFDNKGFGSDKRFKEIGIFVTLDGVAGEHLYSYTNAGDTGDIIPAESRGFYSRTLDVNNYIGYATNITFNIEQTRDNYDFNTENEVKIATFLKKGDKIRLWGRLVLGDIETLNYIVTDEVTSLTLNNGLYCKLAGDNRAFTVENDLINLKGAVVGDVVEVLGFRVKGDGSHHKRVAKAEDDGSGERGQDGVWWCILHNGEVNVSWFGAKDNYPANGLLAKIIAYAKGNCKIKGTILESEGTFDIDAENKDIVFEDFKLIIGTTFEKSPTFNLTSVKSFILNNVVVDCESNKKTGYQLWEHETSMAENCVRPVLGEVFNIVCDMYNINKLQILNSYHKQIFFMLVENGGVIDDLTTKNNVFKTIFIRNRIGFTLDTCSSQISNFTSINDGDAPAEFLYKGSLVKKEDCIFNGAFGLVVRNGNLIMDNFYVENFCSVGVTADFCYRVNATNGIVKSNLNNKSDNPPSGIWLEKVKYAIIEGIIVDINNRESNVSGITVFQEENGLAKIKNCIFVDGTSLTRNYIRVWQLANSEIQIEGVECNKIEVRDALVDCENTKLKLVNCKINDLVSLYTNSVDINDSYLNNFTHTISTVGEYQSLKALNVFNSTINGAVTFNSCDNIKIKNSSLKLTRMGRADGQCRPRQDDDQNSSFEVSNTKLHLSKTDGSDFVFRLWYYKNSDISNSELKVVNFDNRYGAINSVLNIHSSKLIDVSCTLNSNSNKNRLTKNVFLGESKTNSLPIAGTCEFFGNFFYNHTQAETYYNKSSATYIGYGNLVASVFSSVLSLDTPYYALKMQQEGIYEDYVAYRDELHEYENSQIADETMLLPVLQDPVIPKSVKRFAEKYKLI